MPYPLFDQFYSPYGPVAEFLTKGIQPPAEGYIGPADELQLNVLSPNVPTTFNLGLRFLDLKGNISPLFTTVVVPATGATPFVEVINPGECFLLSAVITGANVRRGQCYVTLNLQRGNPMAAASVGMVLLAGYATKQDTIGFPKSIAEDSLRGRGASLVYTGTAPGVGVAPTLTVPPATRWNVWALNAILNAGAVIAQNVIVQITTVGGKVKVLASVVNSGPLDSANNHLLTWGSANIAGTGADTVCNAGDVLTITESQGVGAANQYRALSATVEEFVEL